jgi:hypothetical protein
LGISGTGGDDDKRITNRIRKRVYSLFLFFFVFLYRAVHIWLALLRGRKITEFAQKPEAEGGKIK